MAQFTADTNGTEIVKAFANQVGKKTFLITGASKGSLGAETAISLASASPKEIILVGRNESKISPVKAEIERSNSKVTVTIILMDLCDNSSIRRAAAKIDSQVGEIDFVLNCAGTMAVKHFTPSTDGIENQFAANHLGHFLLTNLIANKLSKTAVFVTVTSMGYELNGVDFEDPNFQGGNSYDPWLAYGQATTAKILFAVALAKKFKIPAFAVHPGYVPSSQLQANNDVDMEMMMAGYKIMVEKNDGKDLPQQIPRTLQQGCATILLAALDPSLHAVSPSLMMECKAIQSKDYATSPANAERLWTLSEKLVGQRF